MWCISMSGRPSDYTPEVADTICQRLVDGESLRAICRDESMPCAATVFTWLDKHEDFRTKYARARDIQADLEFDDTKEIADDSDRDYVETDNGPRFNPENVQRAKLRIETRRWRAEKLKPKKYGPKIEQTHQGPNGGPVMISSVDGDL